MPPWCTKWDDLPPGTWVPPVAMGFSGCQYWDIPFPQYHLGLLHFSLQKALNESEKWLTGTKYGWVYSIHALLWDSWAEIQQIKISTVHFHSESLTYSRIQEMGPEFFSPDVFQSNPIFAVQDIILSWVKVMLTGQKTESRGRLQERERSNNNRWL